MIRSQRTIKKSIFCEGIGLHTGKPVKMTVLPAPTGTGVVFVRTDLEHAEIHAIASNISTTGYATTLSQNNASVKTVEHLLAAFAGLNIDNVYVELDAQILVLAVAHGKRRPGYWRERLRASPT